MAHPLTRRALFAGATAAPACISMPTAAAPARHPDAEIFAALGRLDALYGVYDELIAISAKLTPGTDEHDASADRVAEHGELVEAGLREVFGCRAATIEGVRAQAAVVLREFPMDDGAETIAQIFGLPRPHRPGGPDREHLHG